MGHTSPPTHLHQSEHQHCYHHPLPVAWHTVPTNTNTRGHSGSSENCGLAAATSQPVTTSGAHLQPRTTMPPPTTHQPSPAARRLPPTYSSPVTIDTQPRTTTPPRPYPPPNQPPTPPPP